jgi:hypothetical protein
LTEEVTKDIQAWVRQAQRTEDDLQLSSKLFEERKNTPKGAVAACFHIPWSRLRQLKNGVLDTETHDVFIARDGLILRHVQATGKNLQYIEDLNEAIRANEEFITEMPKRNFFILGPF